jgi:hypothetical protein
MLLIRLREGSTPLIDKCAIGLTRAQNGIQFRQEFIMQLTQKLQAIGRFETTGPAHFHQSRHSSHRTGTLQQVFFHQG